MSVWVNFFLSYTKRKKETKKCNYSFLSFDTLIYLFINVNKKCKLGNFVLGNHNTKEFQKLFLNTLTYSYSIFRQGGKILFWKHFHVYLYHKQKRLSTFLRKLNVKLEAYYTDFRPWMHVLSFLFAQKGNFLPWRIMATQTAKLAEISVLGNRTLF